ncbi:FAD-binding and (Fe-S)-binding domain-containing protein [Halarcobacter anaerophilus]|uniref:D-lactate dehydrogenase (cytochrome) n=1 Tax=Halarcobacter anaerophilus TaxID=877500 RepID=A0A4Q0Y3F3_9BACT|nr:FAD-binding and (Fe-S)-binding domain-containing protein [Halarcobacter anaerophilus]QDF27658.1 FAD/FMN-containing dehydrogenase [Halarcobacter anaerophilus]RXJ64005.1 4Fe-4S ferredoxin [Halarcobacter anaerophilus]
MLEENYKSFYEQISKTIDEKKIFTDKLHTLAYGTDASFYRLIPKIVIKTDTPKEVEEILKLSNNLQLSVTFRAAGTSLSGQAISDSILVVTSRNFRAFSVSKDKSLISLQPALTGQEVNNILAPFSKKIGPDPASINAAMIGGIAANNASGMCCGISQNSYKTLKSMKLIFSDGTKLDTADEKSKENFRKTHKKFLEELQNLSQETKNNKELKKRIQKKYKIKNTCGYSLNALIDFEDVFEILQHLIIGSEGTLAFIEEITYKTVEDLKDKASALIYFKNVNEACSAVTKLKLARDKKEIIVDAVELMDRAGLRSIENDPAMPEFIKEFDEDVTALLIETRAKNAKKLQIQIKEIEKLLQEFKVVRDFYFTTDEKEYTMYWKIRKGLFPAVGAVRETGTTVIIEDVAYPIEKLAPATLELQKLFKKHGYHEALIFGHALDGNFHFVFTQDFSSKEEVKRYDEFMKDVVNQVAGKYEGSLKAEHGTGRNMAAFIEVEWGKTAYNMMKKIKMLFDPKNLLNPGVIINEDKEAHLKNLKAMPQTNDLVDTCIECGFCEPTCPSNDLTLTPRQRIVINREISRLQKEGNKKEAQEYLELYKYDGLETCAACSLCSTACPVKIDTGSLTKHLRAEQISPRADKIASAIANNYKATLQGMRVGLKGVNLVHKILGTSSLEAISSTFRAWSKGTLPKWTPYLPKGININTRFEQQVLEKKVVYFPSCINRSMGRNSKSTVDEELFDLTVKLLKKAGFQIIFPEEMDKLCCGMPFSSKGYKEQGKLKSDELEEALREASKQGAYPILCDMSPCTKTMIGNFGSRLKIYEPIEFALEHLTKELEFTKIDEPITIHTTCSSRKMGLHEKFIELANMCSTKVIIPQNVKCCGFAGDRGFTYPELNDSALRFLKEETKEAKYAFSTSKTCEIGLSEHSNLDYNSIFYLIDKVTVAKNS